MRNRQLSARAAAILAVLLVLSLSAVVVMVSGNIEKDRDEDKDRDISSIGGGSLGVLELGKGGRAGCHDDLGAPAALGRSGWVVPAGGMIGDGAAVSTGDDAPFGRLSEMAVLRRPAEWRPRRTRPDALPDTRPAEDDKPVLDPRMTVLIPEPATLALLSLGGLVLLVRRRGRC